LGGVARKSEIFLWMRAQTAGSVGGGGVFEVILPLHEAGVVVVPLVIPFVAVVVGSIVIVGGGNRVRKNCEEEVGD
jgi:hypothetical protein